MTGREDIEELVGGDVVGLVERLVRWRRSRTARWRCQGVEKSPAIRTTEVAPKATLRLVAIHKLVPRDPISPAGIIAPETANKALADRYGGAIQILALSNDRA
jgi:hypothetical protein